MGLHGAADRGYDDQRHEADGGRVLEGTMKKALPYILMILVSAAIVGFFVAMAIILGGMN